MTWTPTDAADIESIDSLLARFEDNTHKLIGANDSQALIEAFGSITAHLQDMITAQDDLLVAKTTTNIALLGDVQPWDATAAYVAEDLVISNGVVFMAIQDVAVSDVEPVDGTDWKALDYKAQYLELVTLANRVTALEAGP